MTLDVETSDLEVRFGDTVALDGITLSLQAGRIHGLLGRNGAGKTTLLSLLAAFRRPTSGTVRIAGRDPYEDASIMSQVCLVHEGTTAGEMLGSLDLLFGVARSLRPSWDQRLADELAAQFDLPRRTPVGRLSRGQRSAVGVVLGLASRAPLTLFDEAHLGMDAPSRALFHDAVLADYIDHPRTIVLSTHLVDEVADLFEDVTILDRGRLLLQSDADNLRTRGITATGPAEVIDRFVNGRTVLRERRLGATTAVTLDGPLSPQERREATALGLELAAIGLQDLFVHLTTTPEEHRR